MLLEQNRYGQALEELARQGFGVRARGDALCVEPAEAVTPTLQVSLDTHKRALLVALKRRTAE